MAARQTAVSHAATTKRGHSEKLVWMAAERAKRIGRRIRERRDELELTQTQLAELLDERSVTSTYVSRWERGEHEPLGDRLDMIATALKTTSEDLMAGPLAERKKKPAGTPDIIATMNGQPTLAEIKAGVDRVEARLANLVNELRGQRSGQEYDDAEGLADDLATLAPEQPTEEQSKRTAGRPPSRRPKQSRKSA